MATEDERDSPVFVWTFPLIRRFQNRNGLIDFGQSSTVEDTVERVRDSSPVRDKLTEVTSDSDNNDEVGEIESQIEEVQNSSDSVFGEDNYGQAILEDNEVEMSNGVFVPVRLEIDSDEEVVWTNEDDEAHRIMSTSGEEFSSGQIQPGEEFSHTFESEEVTKYIDTVVGGDEMCGAIIVGDAQLEESLRCEEDVDRELFDDELDVGVDETDDSLRTMSSAVEDKEEMDVGF